MKFAEEKILRDKCLLVDSVCGYAKFHNLFRRLSAPTRFIATLTFNCPKSKKKLRRKPKNDGVLLKQRMTHFRHIIRLPSKKSECVVSALKNLQLHYGDNFSKIFKSITADNGSEFADLCNSAIQIYYAPPYSPWERGTNERQNGLVRFFIPKGKFNLFLKFPKKLLNEWLIG